MDQEHITRRESTSGGLGTFQIGGVPVRLHFTFVLLIVFLLVNGLGSNQSAAFYVLYIIALFTSVLIHELSHAWVGARYGIKTVEIVMFPIGGVSRLARNPKPSEEIWIALAGPLANVLVAGVLLGVLAWQGALVNVLELFEPTDSNLVERIAFGNLVLAGFNLLPAFPMDGGRVLRSVLARLKNEEDATRIAAWSGRMLALSMGLYGLLSMHIPLVFVAFFVYMGAAREGAASMGRTLTQGIPVRAAMVTAYHTLSHGSTVRDAANLQLATAQQDFPIVHGEQVIGLLGRSALLRAMAREGPDTYVAAAMDREFPKLSPDMDLAEVLPLMAQAGACALIMQGEQLLGLITSENLSQYLLLRRFGMQPGQART
ncbi:MAG: site-2 protease family protein [Acidobacteriota bacterium]|nr:site-2 protease family protein [Acidobacteriota bacterium]